jgi:spermidine/putrescine transport system ATP-binding protein
MDAVFECSQAANFQGGTKVKVSVGFGDVTLFDNEEEGTLKGVIRFILYKGNHYHLMVLVEGSEQIYVDTNDIWDDGDRIGISIAPEYIHLEPV